jgi:hypothetical protein
MIQYERCFSIPLERLPQPAGQMELEKFLVGRGVELVEAHTSGHADSTYAYAYCLKG